MKKYRVKYQVSPAIKTFYPKEIEIEAHGNCNVESVKHMAMQHIEENTDMEEIEQIIITEVIEL